MNKRKFDRRLRILREYLGSYSLDLSGLTVFTEAASGDYLYTPIACALAGAERVFTVTRDSGWAAADEVRKNTMELAAILGVADRISVATDKIEDQVAQADIITNTGFVRPIDSTMISWMKKTAVVPLMWETWELRPWELDVEACRKRGVLVLGTDEESIGFIQYAGYLNMKLLQDCGVPAYKSRIFIFSSEPVGSHIRNVLSANGASIMWSSFDESPDPRFADTYVPPHDREAILSFLSSADAFVCDEKMFDKQVVGPKGIIGGNDLKRTNESIAFINRSGVLDYQDLRDNGIRIYPDKENRHGTSSVYSYSLGPRVAIELNVAGLKVGEAMARARLSGWSTEESIRRALERSPAMAFDDEYDQCSFRPGKESAGPEDAEG